MGNRFSHLHVRISRMNQDFMKYWLSATGFRKVSRWLGCWGNMCKQLQCCVQ